MKISNVGGRVRLARENKKWTLDQLHKETGLGKGFLSGVENEKHSPSLGNVIALADALGVSVEWIARGKQKTSTCPLCQGKGELSM
jgi:transcriptional regulator with XRE-family HTH domain